MLVFPAAQSGLVGVPPKTVRVSPEAAEPVADCVRVKLNPLAAIVAIRVPSAMRPILSEIAMPGRQPACSTFFESPPTPIPLAPPVAVSENPVSSSQPKAFGREKPGCVNTVKAPICAIVGGVQSP